MNACVQLVSVGQCHKSSTGILHDMKMIFTAHELGPMRFAAVSEVMVIEYNSSIHQAQSINCHTEYYIFQNRIQ